MERKIKIVLTALTGLGLLAGGLTACTSQADTASRNISTDAENFKVQRRIAVLNGITDKILLEAEGKCSVEKAEAALGEGSFDMTCKVGPDEYYRHSAALGDNTTVIVQQLKPIDVSVYHTKVRFAPETLIPEFELNVGQQ
jgi:hypothetical protein